MKKIEVVQASLAVSFVLVLGLVLLHVPIPAFLLPAIVIAAFLTFVIHVDKKRAKPSILWWLVPIAMMALVGSSAAASAQSVPCYFIPVATWYCFAPPSWFVGLGQLYAWFSCTVVWTSVPYPPGCTGSSEVMVVEDAF